MKSFTISLSLLNINPLPEPLFYSLITVFLDEVSPTILIGLDITATLIYGGLGGLLLFVFAGDEIQHLHGVGLGFILWVINQITLLPAAGLGFFGATNPKITLILGVAHLVYGFTIGWGLTAND